MKWQNLILAPLSGLYGMGLSIRHRLFDDHLLPTHEVSIPTICIGNLAVGGTGKTPHTEWVVQQLKDQYNIAVLSRGYGRKTRGFRMADHNSSSEIIGDEPMQIHRKFPDVPVAVCENRVRGIRQLQRMIPDLQAVILDDALQHRSITCGLVVLLTAANNLYIDDHLLPWGRLRDLKRRHMAAHAVIVTKCPEDFKPIDKRVINNRLQLSAYQQLYFSKTEYEALPDSCKRPLIVCAIAQPDDLLQHIRTMCPRAEMMAFGDHHRFSKKDVQRIADAAAKFDTVLTTEKDYERLLLTPLPGLLGDKLHVVRIRVNMDSDGPRLKEQLTAYINETIRKASKHNPYK